jgi:hypothetical protein
MKYLVRIHYYLGVFFAPLIIFFAGTGAAQLFMLHRGRKDGSYTPPDWLALGSRLHMKQEGYDFPALELFKYFAAFMAAGLVVSAVLGVVIALKRYGGRQKWVTLGCLAAGIAVPVLLVAV